MQPLFDTYESIMELVTTGSQFEEKDIAAIALKVSTEENYSFLFLTDSDQSQRERSPLVQVIYDEIAEKCAHKATFPLKYYMKFHPHAFIELKTCFPRRHYELFQHAGIERVVVTYVFDVKNGKKDKEE